MTARKSFIVVSTAPDHAVFMVGRALIGIAIGGFWSMSAATAMRLVPAAQVPRALAIFNGGNALATGIEQHLDHAAAREPASCSAIGASGMELRHLRYFVAVAEELHFKRAADRIGIEQSPLSRSIKALEARLGVELFDRTTRSTRLTAAGERLLAHARSLLAAADEARVDVRTAAGNGTDHLHVGLCDGVPLSRVARLLAALRQETPQVNVHVHEVPMAQKVHELRSGFLDAALAPESGYGRGIVAEPVWQDPLVALLPSDHPLAMKDMLVLSDVVSEPLVLCRPDTGLGQQCQIEQIVRTATATPNIVDRATTHCMLVMLVFAGYGIGIATAAQLEAVGVSELVLRPFGDTPVKVKTWLMMRDATLTEPLARFVEQARRIG